jgi:hypothetical protein
LGFRDWLTKNIYVTSPGDPDPFFRPRRYSRTKEEVARVAQEIVASLDHWRVEEYRENQGRLRAARSRLFPPSAQDINIYIVQGLDGVTKLEMTSQSRGSGGDWGQNRRNLREFLVRLDGRMKPIE